MDKYWAMWDRTLLPISWQRSTRRGWHRTECGATPTCRTSPAIPIYRPVAQTLSQALLRSSARELASADETSTISLNTPLGPSGLFRHVSLTPLRQLTSRGEVDSGKVSHAGVNILAPLLSLPWVSHKVVLWKIWSRDTCWLRDVKPLGVTPIYLSVIHKTAWSCFVYKVAISKFWIKNLQFWFGGILYLIEQMCVWYSLIYNQYLRWQNFNLIFIKLTQLLPVMYTVVHSQ